MAMVEAVEPSEFGAVVTTPQFKEIAHRFALAVARNGFVFLQAIARDEIRAANKSTHPHWAVRKALALHGVGFQWRLVHDLTHDDSHDNEVTGAHLFAFMDYSEIAMELI